MNQGGVAETIGHIPAEDYPRLIEPIGLTMDDLAKAYPLQVMTTGLSYLLVPIHSGIERTGMFSKDYEPLLNSYGAKFAYVFDIEAKEGRTFDFDGLEDVATGSASGPVGAYLCAHGVCKTGEEIIIHQGRFLTDLVKFMFYKKKIQAVSLSAEMYPSLRKERFILRVR